VVRRAEGPRGQERLARLHQAQRAVDAGRLDRLGGGERREDRRDPLGEHRLAAAGRADHQAVVAARGRHAQSPLGGLLAADVGEVDVVGGEPVEPFAHPRRRGRDVEVAGEEPHGLGQRRHRDDLDVLDHGRFRGAGGRHHQPLERPVGLVREPGLAGGGDGDRQRAPRGPRESLQREFAHHGVVAEPFGGELAAAGEDAERDRQVERRRLLGQLGGGEVDDDPVVGPAEAGVDHRPGDAMRALADGRVGHADEHGGRQGPGRDVDLDVHRDGVDAEQREGVEAGEHGTVLS